MNEIGWDKKEEESEQTMLLRGLLGEILGAVDDETAIAYAQTEIKKMGPLFFFILIFAL